VSCVAPIVLIFQRFWQALAAHPEGRQRLVPCLQRSGLGERQIDLIRRTFGSAYYEVGWTPW
jgi:hypothetical protein